MSTRVLARVLARVLGRVLVILVILVTAFLGLLMTAPGAAAHPLGNFTVNSYSLSSAAEWCAGDANIAVDLQKRVFGR